MSQSVSTLSMCVRAKPSSSLPQELQEFAWSSLSRNKLVSLTWAWMLLWRLISLQPGGHLAILHSCHFMGDDLDSAIHLDGLVVKGPPRVLETMNLYPDRVVSVTYKVAF